VKDAILILNAALRFAPPEKQITTSTRSGGSLFSRLFPRRRHDTQKPREAQVASNEQKQVWTLRDNKLAALKVRTGATNGILTQVTGGGVEPGTPLVIDMTGSGV
jgi:HlyD family secretion protein